MKIFITGEPGRKEECMNVIPASAFIVYRESLNSSGLDGNELLAYDLIIDLNLDEHPENLELYAPLENKMVIGCAVKRSLSDIKAAASVNVRCFLAGMNLLPTFINRPKKEMSFLSEGDLKSFSRMAEELGWSLSVVKDQVGMVSPRVMAMIINEACFTLQNNVALPPDIDKGMKLGTAYPLGPLEWADKIGAKNICDILLSIYEKTGDERYRISEVLKEYALSDKSFYAPL